LCASEISPGRGVVPPPSSAAFELVWYGARNGRSSTRPSARPHAEYTSVVSSASSRVISGSTDGIRLASIVLPYPGDIGPQETDEDSGVYYDEILTVRAPRAETREAWALRVSAPTCACGCGGRIEVIPVHRTRGMPKYIHGHHPQPAAARV